MWYQHWGLTDGYQYFQPGWMDAVRAHGSIPLVTWDPWDPTQSSTSQSAYTLQNIINGNFDAYIITWAQASKAWGHPYFLRFAPEMNGDRKSTRLNSSHTVISYAVFCLKKKKYA